MLRAKTKEGNFVTLAILPKRQIEKMRKKRFYCPECNGVVIVRAGPKVIPHFAHKTIVNCSYQGGEGAYHQNGKLLLFQWLKMQNRRTQLEVYLPEINQRPDLFIQFGNRKMALEYQCATIPINEIRKRNAGYKRANITPIWILGANHFKRISHTHFHINSFTLQFVQQFSSELPTMLFYFCPLTKMFSIINDIYITSTNRALAKISFKTLQNLPFTQLFSYRQFSSRKLFALWQKEKRKFRLHHSQAYGIELKWRYWLYEKGLHRDMLPSIVHLPVQSQHVMKVPLWNWQSRLIVEFLHPHPIGKTFSLIEAKRYLQSFMYRQLISFQADPIREYLHLLSELHIVQAYAEDNYVKRKTIHFYDRIDKAIKGDDELLKIFMYNQRQE